MKDPRRHWEIFKLPVEGECTRCKQVKPVAWSYTPNQKRFLCWECFIKEVARG